MSATAVIGIAAGSLAGASAGFAASQPAAVKASVTTGDVSILAVNNLGLSTTRAKNWQCWLRDMGHNPGSIDGQLGSSSWKAAQSLFGVPVDGVVGPTTIKGLQRYLNLFGYGLKVDGIAGSSTKAAFSDFNATGC
ncbi:peptidoglycan-binding protein [Streptomyces sp. NPDC059832]|uniref:peptidoglycan-binding domain-containing protein n=1 Tax=Streptomyces sp. NPDC059832 TaxID=3346966 RepID=UPI00364682D0